MVMKPRNMMSRVAAMPQRPMPPQAMPQRPMPMPPPAMKKGGMAKGKGSGGKTGAEMLKYGRNMAKVASQRPK